MSRIFGEVRQNGYVVRDIEAALHHWTERLGVGQTAVGSDGSSVPGRVGRFPSFLNLPQIPPAVRLRTVEIGEAIDLREPTAR